MKIIFISLVLSAGLLFASSNKISKSEINIINDTISQILLNDKFTVDIQSIDLDESNILSSYILKIASKKLKINIKHFISEELIQLQSDLTLDEAFFSSTQDYSNLIEEIKFITTEIEYNNKFRSSYQISISEVLKAENWKFIVQFNSMKSNLAIKKLTLSIVYPKNYKGKMKAGLKVNLNPKSMEVKSGNKSINEIFVKLRSGNDNISEEIYSLSNIYSEAISKLIN